jgi:NADPH2:quinone reductase
MKAIVVSALGGPEVLELRDLPTPVPQAGEALVKVAAAGINYMDVGNRQRGRAGMEPPFVLGGEISGTVESVGAGVTAVKPGDRVMQCMVPGSYAEYQVVKADRLVPVPDDFDLVEAAAIPLQGMTAHYLLHDFAKVGPGSVVLVHAVAGGMGQMLTRWAKHLGARVIGTTSTAQKAAIAQAVGADDVILYTQTDFAAEVKRLTNGHGADLILDAVGKTTFAGDMDCAAVRGTIVVYGGASGQPDPIVPNTLMAKALKLGGGSLGSFILTRDELLSRADAVIAGLREGWLKLSIERKYPLAEAAEAHRQLQGRATAGKLLLIP